MEVIVEQLGNSHNVIERQRFDKDRITLGRGYANDVILIDEHVDAYHAALERVDDGWQLVDLDSVNGIKKRGVRGKQNRWSVESGDIFVMGRNKIRVLATDHPIPKATPIRYSELFLLWLGQWPVLVSMFVVYFAISAFQFYLNVTTELDWRQLLYSQIQTTLTYVFLVVGVYLLSILFKRSGHFLSHLGVLAFLAVVVAVLDGVMKFLWFNTSSDMDGTLQLMEVIIERGALFAYFWCVFYLAFHLSMKWRTLVSTSLIGLILLTSYLQTAQWQEFARAHSVNADWSMLPPGLLWRSGVAQEDYFDQAFDVFSAVDEERERLLIEAEEAPSEK